MAPDGDTSGRTGHFHMFIDEEPVAAGEVIPREEGSVHSAESEVTLYGLRVGEHRLVVVLGDGTHRRIGVRGRDDRHRARAVGRRDRSR